MKGRSSIHAEILPTHTPKLFGAAARRAVDLLRAGEIVALPTETVYGLAANALNARAVEKIFQAKGRPAHNPIIVHVASLAMARRCAADWPPLADKLAAAFWPGPLTLVLPRAADIPGIVTAGGPTVGIRWPSHPFIQDVIRACGFPLAAPSANPSTRLSPTSARHVQRMLGRKIPLIVDGGPAEIGIESTVLDLTVSPPRLLRPGIIHEESLLAVTGKLTVGVTHQSCPVEGGAGLESRLQAAGRTHFPARGLGRTPHRLKPGLQTFPPGRPHSPHKTEASAVGATGHPAFLQSPGLLRKHYAPRAKLVLLSWRNDADLRAQLAKFSFPAGKIFIIAHTRTPLPAGWGRVSMLSHDPAAYARALYAELHHGDELGAGLIVVETPPTAKPWRAIADRLQRAAA